MCTTNIGVVTYKNFARQGDELQLTHNHPPYLFQLSQSPIPFQCLSHSQLSVPHPSIALHCQLSVLVVACLLQVFTVPSSEQALAAVAMLSSNVQISKILENSQLIERNIQASLPWSQTVQSLVLFSFRVWIEGHSHSGVIGTQNLSSSTVCHIGDQILYLPCWSLA